MERYVTGGAVGVYEKGGAEEMEPGEAPAVRVLILIWGCHEGMSPIQVLQYIASGALGSDAFKGGLATAALGAALHFFIAFVVAAVYYAASRKLAALYRDPTIWGPAFGAAVYLFMNFLVLLLSAVPKSPFSLPLFLNGVFGHAIFVGLPIAWFARRSASKN